MLIDPLLSTHLLHKKQGENPQANKKVVEYLNTLEPAYYRVLS